MLLNQLQTFYRALLGAVEVTWLSGNKTLEKIVVLVAKRRILFGERTCLFGKTLMKLIGLTPLGAHTKSMESSPKSRMAPFSRLGTTF